MSVSQSEDTEWGCVRLTPFGQGAGTFGLPGDYTPPSRFVRTAFQKSCTPPPADADDAAVTCFHLMESVSIPKGIVMTSRDTTDYTQYTAFINLSSKEYFFKTYYNSQIMTARLSSNDNEASKIKSLGMLSKPRRFLPFHSV